MQFYKRMLPGLKIEPIWASLARVACENLPRPTIKIMRPPAFIKAISSNPSCQFQITTTEFRRHFGAVLDWAGKSNEHIMITARGQNVAILVPLTTEEQEIFLRRSKRVRAWSNSPEQDQL